MSPQVQTGTLTKRTSWAVAVFYLLIAFEFFYMASPFAIYLSLVTQTSLFDTSISPSITILPSG